MSDDPKIIIAVGPQTGSNFTLTQLWAAIERLPDGDEAIPCVYGPRGEIVPLIAADEKRLRDVREQARQHSRRSGRPVTIVRFSVREDIEVIRWGQ